MRLYGSDKPDIRFGMQFVELMDVLKGHGFSVFDNATYIGGICAEGAAGYTRKQLDALTEFVKKPQIGAKGMVYARIEADGTVKSSVDKFYSQEVLYEASLRLFFQGQRQLYQHTKQVQMSLSYHHFQKILSSHQYLQFSP